MLWITPTLSADIGCSLRLETLSLETLSLETLRLVRERFAARIAEQLLKPVPALLEPVERQPQVGDRVADSVEARLAVHLDEQPALVADRFQAATGELGGQ